METQIEPIWKPCSKEEFEKAFDKHPYTWFFDYLRKPIYDGPAPQGLLAQMQPDTRKIIGYNYFKKAGKKIVLLCNSWEIETLEKVGITAGDVSEKQWKQARKLMLGK